SSGTNVIPSVDGADNRDNQFGGPLLAFSTEALEQFQLATSQFNAADGRTGGAALTMVTKSGTNVLHGSAFGFGRSDTLAAKDFFTREANRDKIPYDRQQYGGSIGGPIIRSRAFFFGAIERIQEDSELPVPANLFAQKQLLVDAQARGLIPQGFVNPNNPTSVAQPARVLLSTAKVNLQLNNAHGLMVRYAGDEDYKGAATFQAANDNREPENTDLSMWSVVGQHNWVLGNNALNQIVVQMNSLTRLSDTVSQITGEHFMRDYPNVPLFPLRLAFPSVNTGAGGQAGSITDTQMFQLRDEVSLQTGTHAMKFGVNYNFLNDIGLLNGNALYGILTFFDDPSVILSNSNGRYPQGFQTPGIVREWSRANPDLADSLLDAHQIATWFQDDWRVTPRLTLNLGIRYDIDVNFYHQSHSENNATRLVLEAIGNPNARAPKMPYSSVSPRFGFAYDLSGDGRRVLRGGGGVYFDQFNINGGNVSDIFSQNKRPLNVLATLTNTAFGVGQLATFRFGLDPLPEGPGRSNTLQLGSRGEWLSPDLVNPRNYQGHIGYAHQLADNTSVSVDYTHVEGRNELRAMNINPIVNGRRVLADDFQRVFGNPNYLSDVRILSSNNRSRYDALTFKVQRRLPRATLRAHYTLAGAFAYGGSIAARGAAPIPMNAFEPFAESEWGPTPTDERHRLVAMGVFEVGYGIQLSPVFQAASARPYNLTAGSDLNRDGNNNDRWVDPATGKQVHINAGRGDNTFVFDLRTTKFFELGGDRRLGLFVEGFNLFNTANFGERYQGNGRSTAFRQPNNFVAGIGYPRQAQIGLRFLF
ncbi:MAG: TonB-dependent receptor, partial [Acidobacteria bacterium]|nr:TonB-dependent receptor [Acidobacteriota bacterium]